MTRLTKQEAQALVKYNDEVKNHRWASKPQIRKYDKIYNGKLRIVFGERSYIRDNWIRKTSVMVKVNIETAKADIGSQRWTFKVQKSGH